MDKYIPKQEETGSALAIVLYCGHEPPLMLMCPLWHERFVSNTGAVYHVTVRGNQIRDIFLSKQDHERFLFKLEESAQRYDVRVYLFCLMTNHVHLVVETPRGNLGQFMHRLQTAYTVYFNRFHRQSGHLTQVRYGAILIDKDEYILKLSRYVHLNPVYIAEHRNKTDKERGEN